MTTPSQVAQGILDLSKWPSFTGWGLLPGIRSAVFETPPDPESGQVIGTRIRVTNTDGSTHVEEIMEWDPPRVLTLRLGEFSRPLSRLSTYFIETWQFGEPTPDGRTPVTRTFELYPTSRWARVPLRLIAWMMKRAVNCHMRQIDGLTGEPETP